MKLSRRSRWILILALFLGAMIIFLTQVEAVKATFSDVHTVMVLLRVETEIMQKTPAGQYYESLFWKHNDELMKIFNAHPEHMEPFMIATRVFIPELDALLNGNGDEVYVTSEHVESLKSELDWFASRGSPSLREDIQREQQRLPLDTLIGMTMNEALDFINSNWSPNSVAEKTLVPDSYGEWAYYVHNGVYLEYPSSYNLQVSEIEKDFIYFMPSTGTPEQWNPCVMKVRIWNVPVNEKDANNPHSWYSPESIVWESSVQNPQFQGVEFVSSIQNLPVMDFHAFQYNEEHQLAVDIWVFVTENPQVDESFDYSEMINQQYEYFQHMVDSLQIRNFSTQPTSVPEPSAQQTLVPNSVVQQTSIPGVVVEQTLVPDSDGKWAYYVHNGVYLEYSSSYDLQVSQFENDDYIYFWPSADVREEWNQCPMKVRVWNIPINEKDVHNPRSWYTPESIVWESIIQNPEFPGVEFVSRLPSLPVMEVHAFQYNQETQVAVNVWAFVDKIPQIESLDHSEMISQRCEYFQHMVESVKIQLP